MSANEKRFYVIQISLVKNEQQTFLEESYEDTSEGRNLLFKHCLQEMLNARKIVVDTRSASKVLIFKQVQNSDIVYIQFAKQTKREINKLLDDEILTETLDDFPPIDLFVNLRLQQVLIESKESVVSLNEVVAAIDKIFAPYVKKENYSVYFNAINDIKSFWQLVDKESADEIFEIKFDMIAPNLFGLNGKAKDLVQHAKENINASEVAITLKSRKGKLKASMKELDSFVEYSSFNGGWKVKIRKDGKIKTLKSDDTYMQKNVSELVIDGIKQITENNNVEAYQYCIDELSKLFVDRK